MVECAIMKITIAQRQKMAERQRRKWAEDTEYREKMVRINTGKKMSPETCKKMSMAKIGKKYRLGAHHTEETKEKLRIIAKTAKRAHYITEFGAGKNNPTLAERTFAKRHPEYIQEKPFGTGPGGMKIWKTNHYIADFYDPINSIIYEIDGEHHDRPDEREHDKRRDAFFRSIGIETIRYTNEEITGIKECR